MEIELYYNQSDERNINKKLIPFKTITGTLKQESSVMSPQILVDNDSVLRCNYAYVDQFQRYYSIAEVTSVRTGLWQVSMECDVLMSFRYDILNLGAIVDKQTMQSNGDEYIDDGSLVADNNMFTRVYNFPNGFNDNGEFILITAG